jgi:mono/diheme cytochrome c family protein
MKALYGMRLLGWLAAVMVAVAMMGAPVAEALAEDAGASVDDVALPVNDPAALELGRTRLGEKCSGFCHGSGGKGGRGPCLICGRFKRGANNSDLIRNVTEGIKGTPMGAFGDVLTKDEILAVVAYLRVEQKKKEQGQ